MNGEKQDSGVETTGGLIENIVLASLSPAICTRCGTKVSIMPLDDQPLDEAFLANYVCDECEDSDA